MEASVEPPSSFDARATAAVLRSGSNIAMAGHVAAVLSLLPISKGGLMAWIGLGSLLVWSAGVYLSIRVKIDAGFFELLAEHPAERLDRFLEATGLRRPLVSRTLADRRRGALRLWRALVFAVTAQIALVLAAIVSGLS